MIANISEWTMDMTPHLGSASGSLLCKANKKVYASLQRSCADKEEMKLSLSSPRSTFTFKATLQNAKRVKPRSSWCRVQFQCVTADVIVQTRKDRNHEG